MRDKMNCLEWLARHLEFATDDAFDAVVSAFKYVAAEQLSNGTKANSLVNSKYSGDLTTILCDMLVQYDDEPKYTRGLLKILDAALVNKSNLDKTSN